MSFMVPYGTSVRAYGDNDRYGTTGTGKYNTIVGKEPINDYGELACTKVTRSHRWEFYRTVERPQVDKDETAETAVEVRSAIGYWQKLISGRDFEYSFTVGFENSKESSEVKTETDSKSR